ncbi:phage tail fiber protein [Klebsiella pneumoniae]|uniref:phage tail fiber domain-containing protein n=1 Tax=Klebsiella pneumoniae TaxID=573 RepID=UPI0030ECBB8E
MTVSTQVSRNEYTGNGATTQYDFTFRILDKSHLLVQTLDTSESIVTLTLGTDYTVTGVNRYNGGKVVLISALPAGYKISIERNTPVTQEASIRNQGGFFPEIHEDAFDKLTMLVQQAYGWWSGLSLRKPSWLANYYDALNNRIRNLRDPSQAQDAATKGYADNLYQGAISHSDNNFKRTLRVPESEVGMLPGISGRRKKILAFNDTGNPISVPPESGSAADVMIELASSDGFKWLGRCSDVGALRLLEPTFSGQIIPVVSYHAGWSAVSSAPVGGGDFYYDANDTTSADDGVMVFVTGGGRRWKRITDDITLEMAGAYGDGVNDDTVYLQRAFNLMLNKHLSVRSGRSDARYRFTSQLTIYAVDAELKMGRSRFVADHTVMTSGFAIRVMGDTGRVYNLGSKLQIRLQGPYGGENFSRPPALVSGTLDGIGIYPGDSTQVSDLVGPDWWVEGFRRNICIGPKSSYLITLTDLQCNKYWESGVYLDAVNDAGENIAVRGGKFSNGINANGNAAAIRVPSTSLYLNAQLHDVSFDYGDLVFDIYGGILHFFGCHWENNSSNPYGLLTYTSGRRKPQVFMHGLNIDGGSDIATVYANQGDATGKRVWFKTSGPCVCVADGGTWGKYSKMQSLSIFESTGTGALTSVDNIFFDMQPNVDLVRMGGYNTPLRNANYATQDTTGWTVSYSYPSEITAVKPTVTYDGTKTSLGPALKISSPSPGGETTTTIRQKMAVKPGKMLYFGTRLLWENIYSSNGNAYAEYAFFDDAGTEIGRGSVGVNMNTQPSSQSTPVVCSRSVIVPPGAVRASIGFRHYQCRGDIWLGPIFAFTA